jgi:hypothetical protein
MASGSAVSKDKRNCDSPTSVISNDTFLIVGPGPETLTGAVLTQLQSFDRSETTKLSTKKETSTSSSASLSRQRKTTGIPKHDILGSGLRIRCDIDAEAQTKTKKLKEVRLLAYKHLRSVFFGAYVILAIVTMAMYEVFEPSPSFRSNHVRHHIDGKFFNNAQEVRTTIVQESNADIVTKPADLLVEERTPFSHEIPEVDDELERRQRRLQEARKHVVAPLDLIDREHYTIRLNTWNRNEQLLASINHHSRCVGVAQIQIVWCNMEEEPPTEVVNHPSGKVVVEKHVVNTLNERFNLLTTAPTKGIISMDDDILRSCEALDSAFFRWTRAPDSIVGYDARLHGVKDDGSGWKVSVHKQSSLCTHQDFLFMYLIPALPFIVSIIY